MLRRIIKKACSKPKPSQPGEINYGWVDRFTIVHFLIGCTYGWLNVNVWIMLMLAIGWEVIENALKANLPFIFPHGTADTLKNIIGDCVAVVIGWWIIKLANN